MLQRLLTGMFVVIIGASVHAAEPAAATQNIDWGLETPVIVTKPGPEYDAQGRDYGMVIGMDRTPKGRVWACWVAGGDNDHGFFVAASSDDGAKTWSKPRLVIDPSDPPGIPRRRTLVGNFWTGPTGRLWLFFDQSVGYFDGRAGAWAITCDNPDADEPTWSAPRRIWHGCTLNKPTVLKSGEWLMPISLWTRDRINKPERETAFKELDEFRMANVFASTDQGKTWTRRGGARFPNTAFDEHMIVELKDGRLWMLARTSAGHIAESFSVDAGRTWQEPRPSGIRNLSARFFLRRLASGNLLLVKNGGIDEALKQRSHLSAFLSKDDGKTWEGGLMLDERSAVSYPDGFQSPDGLIWIVYDRNRATDGEILIARFSEKDVESRRFESPGAAERVLVSKPEKKKAP
ncbi:sialidase family protein [Humisphaera borealis]|uniref:Exo-alpha-sialidase n=1 Tax=Humisphaera borealis TaxID=2807512 RepID=A0A7M2WVF4_9BACT|nr:sialidase family protein [Humisphaera borealis]QOV89212.1 exo-alpha-sialidase [Humisphaera borealis]